MTYNFQNTYTDLSPKLFQNVKIPDLTDPEIVLLNTDLIQRLGIHYTRDQDPKLLLGSAKALPFAQAYAGHQFGHFTVLGDGRAMILGEHLTPDNRRCDIQLKGSGVTQYSRGGDGRATMSSMLREYLYSFAMKHLGIKTSESLAVISTNQKVLREEVHDGAVLIRAMESHIRFGTFEYVSKFCTHKELREFTDYAIQRHYPELIDEEQKYVKFFQSVVKKTVQMIVDWYRVGFIHGVMNTDNMSITGETFDYGPCAFMNRYDPLTTFSQIDRCRRYCFGKQKDILKWNLGIFGTSIRSLFDTDSVLAEKLHYQEMDAFDSFFESKYIEMMKNKLGITNSNSAKGIVDRLLHFLEKGNADYTNTFVELMYPNSIDDELYQTSEFLKLRSDVKKGGLDLEIMKVNNPQRIPRNYLVEQALHEYKRSQNLDKINKLLKSVSTPYRKNDRLETFQEPPPREFDTMYTTHCNT